MPAKQKAKRKGKAFARAAVEEPVESQEPQEQAQVEPKEQEDPVRSESEEEGTCTYRSERFAMSAHHKTVHVQWFSKHPEFYQKSYRQYTDKSYKEKQLGIIAAKLDEPGEYNFCFALHYMLSYSEKSFLHSNVT